MPLRLSRVVRCSVNDPAAGPPGPVRNGYAGWPTMRGLGRHYELRIECEGDTDPVTGYFLNIAEIDRAARSAALPVLERACATAPASAPADVLPAVVSALRGALGGALRSVRWSLSPTYSVEMEVRDMERAIIRQRFEFAASHRLHADALTPDRNREVFGKCNNPSGHGHNYVVEPAVAVRVGGAFGLEDLERLTDEAVIRRFDHTHLNLDTEEFRSGRGLNPSVENIAKVCYELLRPAVRDAGADLLAVTVWETEKTSCTYPA